METITGNILSLSREEVEILEEAKASFDKSIVLINAANPMEIGDLAQDPEVDAILGTGFP